MPYRYLLDANCFTQAFHQHYCFDTCPGFWRWIEHQNQSQVVYSIDRIRGEITRYENDLSEWANAKQDNRFFLSTQDDRAVARAYGEVAAWVENSHFKRRGKDEFMAGNDGWLIAYAKVYDFTIVTFEVWNPDERRKIKIPALATPLRFRSIMLHDVLRETHVRLMLEYEEGWG